MSPVNLPDTSARKLSAVDEAIAAIIADGERRQAEHDRIAARCASDRRLAFLTATANRYAAPEITEGGMIGGMQMLISIMRPEQAVFLRADYLRIARVAQLRGNRAAARMALAKALGFARDPRLSRNKTPVSAQAKKVA